MVRATFKMRSWARAESPMRVMAFSSIFSPSSEMAQNFRISFGGICAFAKIFFSPGESLDLERAGAQHALAHRCGIFRGGRAAEFLVLHCGHFDVDIDAIDQRPGNFRNVALNLRRRAVTLRASSRQKIRKDTDSSPRRA